MFTSILVLDKCFLLLQLLLQSENKAFHLQLKECEGSIVKLNSTVQKLENNVESLQIYSMKTNLMLCNISEVENEDYYAVVNAFMQNDLKISSSFIFFSRKPMWGHYSGYCTPSWEKARQT